MERKKKLWKRYQESCKEKVLNELNKLDTK